jgi:hypothetical protein
MTSRVYSTGEKATATASLTHDARTALERARREYELGELYLRLGTPEQAELHLARALELPVTAADRAYVKGLVVADRARARKRVPRPSFRLPFGGKERGGKR